MTDNNTTDTSASDNAEVDVKSYKSLEQAFSLGNGQNTALNWLKETNQVQGKNIYYYHCQYFRKATAQAWLQAIPQTA